MNFARPKSACFQSFQEVSDFIVHLLRVRDRLGDFLGKQFTITLAKPVDGRLRCRLGKTDARRRVRVGGFSAITEKELFEHLESSAAMPTIEFLAQTLQDGFQHGLRPKSVIEAVGRAGVGRQKLVVGFRARRVFQRKELLAAAPLLAVCPIPFVGEIILQRREQKGAEPAPFAIGCFDRMFLQEAREKTLSQVLRVVLVAVSSVNEPAELVAVMFGERKLKAEEQNLVRHRGARTAENWRVGVRSDAGRGRIPIRLGNGDHFASTRIHWVTRSRGMANADESKRLLISGLITPQTVTLCLTGRRRDDVLGELVAKVAEISDRSDARQTLLRALQEREQLHSTGIGDGVALPHARNALVGLVEKPVIVFGRHEQGIPYGAIDAQPARIFFLLVTTTVTQHLQILARISRLIRDPRLRQNLLAADRPEKVIQFIREVEAKM